MAGGSYPTTAKIDAFSTQVEQRLKACRAFSPRGPRSCCPWKTASIYPSTFVGHPPAKGKFEGDEQWRSVSGDYFKVFRIPLLRGRLFTERDKGNSTPSVIINDVMAQEILEELRSGRPDDRDRPGTWPAIRRSAAPDRWNRRQRLRVGTQRRQGFRDVYSAEPDAAGHHRSREQHYSTLMGDPHRRRTHGDARRDRARIPRRRWPAADLAGSHHGSSDGHHPSAARIST